MKTEKTATLLERMGNRLFVGILVAGAGMLVLGMALHIFLEIDFGLMLVVEGVAFITIGIVGIDMFLTTRDVAKGIKEEIRESSTSIKKEIKTSSEGIKKEIKTSSEGIKASIDGLAESMGTMAATLTRIETLLSKK